MGAPGVTLYQVGDATLPEPLLVEPIEVRSGPGGAILARYRVVARGSRGDP
jgi:hypothetical protein